VIRRTHVDTAIHAAQRLLCLCAGALLAAVLPAAHSASVSRASNAAIGYLPNMDPGVGISLALLLAIPVLIGVIAIELCRAWAWGKRPLALPSYFMLGVAATWPIGAGVHGIFWACPLSIAAFYGIRSGWMAGRPTRHPPAHHE
jgi:hypothetical protein